MAGGGGQGALTESSAEVRATPAASPPSTAPRAAPRRTTARRTAPFPLLHADFAAVLETATGEFEQDYQKTTGRLRARFEQTQAVAVGTVVGAGLEELDLDESGRDRAVAVVAVDQVIATADAPARTERNRLRMVLVRPADTWLVQAVERL